MRLPVLISTAILAAAAIAAGSFVLLQHPQPATAASGVGTITGRVVWNYPLVVPYGSTVPGIESPDGALPEEGLELAPEDDFLAEPGVGPEEGLQMPPSQDGTLARPGIPIRPIPIPRPRVIPAGAVLVAVQGTDLSARTDERGYFRIENVPAGQFLTVAAGPAGGVAGAIAIRPNVQAREDRTISLGTMYLGQPYSYGYPYPYPYPAMPDAAEGAPDSAEPAPEE